MSDSLQFRGAKDRQLVNLGQYHEIQYWTEKLGCTFEELCKAVSKVGNSADAVRRELRKKNSH